VAGHLQAVFGSDADPGEVARDEVPHITPGVLAEGPAIGKADADEPPYPSVGMLTLHKL
jgi:hypothetical protein